MFEPLQIQSIYRTYSVDFSAYESALKSVYQPGDILIIDSNILDLYPAIAKFAEPRKLIQVTANEKAKEYSEIGKVIDTLIKYGVAKNNRLIAIGGGVTQDITAFTASILLRGIEWLFFPTNLLSQCDSCIGSKTSVNFGQFKNQLGGFYPPSQIYIDLAFLETLPDSEIDSGLGEMLHYFLVDSDYDLQKLGVDITYAKEDRILLNELIYRSLVIKKNMIEKDEFDRGPRNVFNYGHSFGHALESVTCYKVPHGVAVAFGMDLANVISANKGMIDMSLRNQIRPILAKVWHKACLPKINIEDYFLALAKDKKNVDTEVKVILTKGLGNMFKTTLNCDVEMKHLVDTFFNSKWYEKSL